MSSPATRARTLAEGTPDGPRAGPAVGDAMDAMSREKTDPNIAHRGHSSFGLQARLTVIVVGMTFSVAWLACTYLVSSSTHLVREEQSAYAMQSANLLARTVSYAQAANDRVNLNDVVKEAIGPSRLIFADVYDSNWQPIATSREALAERIRLTEDTARPLVGNPSFRAAHGTLPAHLEVIYPVRRLPDSSNGGAEPSPAALHYVRVGVTVQNSLDWTSRTVDVLIGVGIMVGLLAIPLCFLLARRLVVPLERVIDTMNEFAGGDLSARAPIYRSDELGMLADTFNAMADSHESTHQQLVTLNADLERRVTRRTRELRDLALRDPLTGLFNRRHFDEVLSNRFAEAKRYSEDLTCVMIDVDDFKPINDQFGHDVGDAVLNMLAGSIKRQMRVADVAARFGGDEFILLLPKTSATQAGVLCGRIQADFTRVLRERDSRLETSLSIGVADMHDPEAADGPRLIRAADRAMYRAKGGGKHRIEGTVAAGAGEPAASKA